MEVDPPQHTRHSPFIAYFDTSPSAFPFPPPIISQIEHRRALLADQLLFDIVLSAGGIRVPDLIYPPHDEEGLQRLLDAIAQCNYDALKKDCLVYFLLKWHQDGREERFMFSRCIPPQFAMLSDAYWYLDAGVQVPKAVSLLADRRLNKDYPSKILQCISLSPDAAALIRQYVRTAQPPLTEPDDLDVYTLALAENSLLDAWQFQRTFAESKEIRPRLFKKLVQWCIAPEPKPIPLKVLLHLPLSSYEESQLHSYAITPSNDTSLRSLCVLQDLICVRLIQTGRYADAIKMNHKFLSSPSKNAKESKDRVNMISGVYSALSSVERNMVDLEIDGVVKKREDRPKARKSVSGGVLGSVNTEGDLSMSWEEVRASDIPRSSTATPLKEMGIPERSGAPRFGGPIPPPAAPNASASVKTPAQVPTTSTPQPSRPAFTPRKSLPAPSTTPVPAIGSARPPMSGAAKRVSLGRAIGVSSPASGLRFASPQTTPKPNGGFTSALKQPNAFYQPPAREKEKEKDTDKDKDKDKEREKEKEKEKGKDKERTVEEPRDLKDAPPVPEGVPAQEDEDISMHVDHQDTSREDEGHDTENEGLSYSVFGAQSPETPVSSKSAAKMSPRRIAAATGFSPAQTFNPNQSVPGAFASEDELTELEEDHEEEEKPKPTRRTRTRATPTRAKKKDPHPRGRISIPGAFAEADEDEGEDGDHIAPLPASKGRRGRVSASNSTSDMDDEREGMQTRRRSSRLSHAGSSNAIEESVSAAPVRTKKTTRNGTTKKRK